MLLKFFYLFIDVAYLVTCSFFGSLLAIIYLLPSILQALQD